MLSLEDVVMDMSVKIRNVSKILTLILFLIFLLTMRKVIPVMLSLDAVMDMSVKIRNVSKNLTTLILFLILEENNSCDTVFGCNDGYVCQNQKCVNIDHFLFENLN